MADYMAPEVVRVFLYQDTIALVNAVFDRPEFEGQFGATIPDLSALVNRAIDAFAQTHLSSQEYADAVRLRRFRPPEDGA